MKIELAIYYGDCSENIQAKIDEGYRVAAQASVSVSSGSNALVVAYEKTDYDDGLK